MVRREVDGNHRNRHHDCGRKRRLRLAPAGPDSDARELMAPSSHVDCAPWAFGTSQLHQPHLGRMALPNDGSSYASTWSRFAPHRRGLQNGILGSGGTAGTLAGGALMPILVTGSVSLFGLSAIQSGFLWSALPGIVMVLIVPLVILNRPEEIGLRSLDANEQEPALAGKQAPLKRPSRALGT
jgi:hypothetical protein